MTCVVHCFYSASGLYIWHLSYANDPTKNLNTIGGCQIASIMETADEMAEGHVRRFLTTLFVARKRRLLKTLATLYGWSPEELKAHEDRFIKIQESVPLFN